MTRRMLWMTAGIATGVLIGVSILLAFWAGESVQEQRQLVLQVRDLERTVDRLEANNARLRESVAAATGSASSLPVHVSGQVEQYGVDVKQASYRSTSSFVPEPRRSCFRMNLGSNVRVQVCESR